MNKNCNGAQRIAKYLYSKHRDTFLEAGKERGLFFSGTMDAIEAAAMWRDAGVMDRHAMTILRHLRCFFHPHKIARIATAGL